jgi:hypothetical protein
MTRQVLKTLIIPSPEEVRAIREACPGLAGVRNAAGFPFNPAGLDDPRCQAQR